MTALAGDALSHVDVGRQFSALVRRHFWRWFSDDDSAAPNRGCGHHRHLASTPLRWFRPHLHGGHERDDRNEPSQLASFKHYL